MPVIVGMLAAFYFHIVKKAASIVLILLYAATFMGAGLTVRYCCGRLSAIEWFATSRNGSLDEGTTSLRSLGCCSACTVQFQAAPAESLVFAPLPDPVPDIPDAFLFAQEVERYLPSLNIQHDGLETIVWQSPPLFLMNRVFRI